MWIDEKKAVEVLSRSLLRHCHRPEHPGAVAEGGRDDVAVDGVEELRHLDVAVERALHLLADHREEVRLVHDPPAEDDALRREDDLVYF